MKRPALVVMVLLAGCRSASSPVLVRIDAELPGEHCAAGGAAILTGTDANDNGALDDEEIVAAQTKYVCNGTIGQPGQPGQPGEKGDAGVGGHNALTVLTAEPAGPNCQFGGTKVEAGLDLDDSGTLSADEITNTSYVCDRSSVDSIYFGDLVIASDEDLALLEDIRVVVGSLDVRHAPGGVLTLPTLEVVSGTVLFGREYNEWDGGWGARASTPVHEAHFAKLKNAGRFVVSDQYDLTVVDAPVLERVSELRVYETSLTTVSLPALTYARRLELRYNAELTSAAFAQLGRLLELDVYANDALTTLTFAQTLTVTDYLGVRYNALLSDCFAWRLVSLANGELSDGYNIYANADAACAASDVCRPVLVAGLTGFSICQRPSTWVTALGTCQTLGAGASLAWFETAAEWTAFSTAVYDGELSPGYVGYSDEATEGTWEAASGFTAYDVTAESTFWAQGEPNGEEAENYVEIIWSGRANDTPGDDIQSFYCRTP